MIRNAARMLAFTPAFPLVGFPGFLPSRVLLQHSLLTQYGNIPVFVKHLEDILWQQYWAEIVSNAEFTRNIEEDNLTFFPLNTWHGRVNPALQDGLSTKA
ncbi:hypothetical protein [Coleofasciculus sp. FACHB-1120]|uniref:hypothetical protein n=1 Tax=Coleofasciculus sp. FACHB-1120 TaxID=2692783 RepID=UPI001689946D|nr:hypothetical protein [Coleofasciculus sp. FACHB-1120]MBD2743462.1 hypothetical protein [Coleofasciculus sp. FACHB-1120]